MRPPTSLKEVLSQEAVTSVLQEAVEKNLVPHMLFYGPPGTGKSSTISAMARDYYGAAYVKLMVLELNGSDERGISTIRTQVKNFAKFRSFLPGKPKLIVLDEADSLTFDAQSALRRVIEKYTQNVRFCLVCNYRHKLIPAIQSRCVLFQFRPVRGEAVFAHLRGLYPGVGQETLETVVRLSGGDMRKVHNVLGGNGLPTLDSVYRYFYGVDTRAYLAMVQAVRAPPPFEQALRVVKDLRQEFGVSVSELLPLVSQAALENEQFALISRLGKLELFYVQSSHTFEDVFAHALAFTVSCAA